MTAETGNHSCACGGEFVVTPTEAGDHRTLVCSECGHVVHEVAPLPRTDGDRGVEEVGA